MPRANHVHIKMEELTVEQRLLEPEGCQQHWYAYATKLLRGQAASILDVGAGTGYSLATLRDVTPNVLGIDPLPINSLVQKMPDLLSFSSNSYDAVLCIDVIEHVEEDLQLAMHLLRIAAKHVFISTPNWYICQAKNRYHCREYTPGELLRLLSAAAARVHKELAALHLYTSGNDRTVRSVRDFALDGSNISANIGMHIKFI